MELRILGSGTTVPTEHRGTTGYACIVARKPRSYRNLPPATTRSGLPTRTPWMGMKSLSSTSYPSAASPSPSARDSAFASIASLSGVAVPCALT